MSRAARSACCGFFMWLPEPFSSPAPHFDGQRWLSGGRFHCAAATSGVQSNAIATAVRVMVSPSVKAFVKALVIKSVGHLRQLVSKLPLVLLDAFRVERVALAPGLDERLMVETVAMRPQLVACV